ncbi:MAG: CapA family protein [Tannerellaceae bacterium]|nr:CapA family protein [Tannerellaceae bacterium]
MSIEILVTGDFCPHNRTIPLVQTGTGEKIWNDFLPYSLQADLAVINLECPLTDKKLKPISKIGPNLKAPFRTADILQQANYGLVTLANNHIMDYGVEGLTDTLDVLTHHHIDYVGIITPEKQIPVVIHEIKEVKIAILNLCENEFSTVSDKGYYANGLHPIQNYYQLAEECKEADLKVVILHGGIENYALPSPGMKEIGRYFVDIGADVVLCHHTHCYSGYEIYKNKPIFYGLGNFSFDWENRSKEKWNYGYAVKLNYSKRKGLHVELIPYIQGSTLPGIKLLSSEERKAFDSRLENLNQLIQDDKALGKEYTLLSDSLLNTYDSFLELYYNRYFRYLKRKKLLPSLTARKNKLRLFNLIRCESHRDLFLKALLNYTK